MEASALARQGGCAELQRVEYLLPGAFNDAQLVAERVDRDNVTVGDIARLYVRADAAAVDERHISAGDCLVRIGAQVAEVGFGNANQAQLRVRRVVYHKVNVGVRHDRVHQLLILRLNVVNVAFCAVVVEQRGVKLAVRRDGQAADVCQLRAGRGENDLLAVLVLDKLFFNDGVAVPVEHNVNAGGVCNNIGGCPR